MDKRLENLEQVFLNFRLTAHSFANNGEQKGFFDIRNNECAAVSRRPII